MKLIAGCQLPFANCQLTKRLAIADHSLKSFVSTIGEVEMTFLRTINRQLAIGNRRSISFIIPKSL
jgi:hypothetical protein